MNYANSTEYTVTLFDCSRLEHVIVLWQMQKFMCYYTVFPLFYFEFKGNLRVQVPVGLYLEGQFLGRFFELRVWGGEGYIWTGLFLEFYGMFERNLIVVAWLSLTKSKSL